MILRRSRRLGQRARSNVDVAIGDRHVDHQDDAFDPQNDDDNELDAGEWRQQRSRGQQRSRSAREPLGGYEAVHVPPPSREMPPPNGHELAVLLHGRVSGSLTQRVRCLSLRGANAVLRCDAHASCAENEAQGSLR